MITLITGIPGAGKTLRAVELLQDALKSGRQCFSDIEGLKLPGVMPAPDDWRELPDGSYIVYDECHRRWPATGKPGPANNPIIDDLDTHRHKGFDFVLMTQWPTKVHHVVRGNVGAHHHIVRLSGASVGTIYKWQHVCGAPDDRREKDTADSSVWKYPKQLYPFYKSSSLHTSAYKFRVPSKIKLVLVVAGLIFAGVGWRVMHSSGVLGQTFGGGGAASAAAPAAVPPARVVTRQSGWVGTVGGCIASDRACRCFDPAGAPVLEMDEAACRVYIRTPQHSPVNLGTSKGDA
jgi:zona occludens toxin